MRVAILDDWFDTLRTLPCFERLDGHDVTVLTDHVQETDPLAGRLQGFDALVLISALNSAKALRIGSPSAQVARLNTFGRANRFSRLNVAKRTGPAAPLSAR